jgi:hypothetical protein
MNTGKSCSLIVSDTNPLNLNELRFVNPYEHTFDMLRAHSP